MKTIQYSLFCLLIGVGVSFINGCSSDDGDADPCPTVQCQNGGNKVNCACDCPAGFTGPNCETEIVCVDVSCPEGETANPANDCQCE